MTMESINPATGQRIAVYDEMAPAQVEEILRRVDAAFRAWRDLPFAARAECLRGVGAALRRRKEELAVLARVLGSYARHGVRAYGGHAS